MNMPDRIIQALFGFLPRIGIEKSEIIIDRTRDHVKVKALRRRRPLIHEKRQALGTGISEPFFDR